MGRRGGGSNPRTLGTEPSQTELTRGGMGGRGKDSLEALVTELRDKYGKGVIGLASTVKPIERMSTGVEKLDRIIGGGYPKGRLVEVWGTQGSGKTSLVYRAIAAAQASDPKAKTALFDLENTFNGEWAAKHGVDLDRLLVVKALPAEDAGELITKMVRKSWALVAVDSVVELIPEKELKKKLEEESYAVVARVLSRLLPKIVVLQASSPTLVILVNQVRDKIGFFVGQGEKSPGGHALFHLDSLKLQVKRKGFLMDDDNKKKIGFEVAVRVVKSKVSKEQEMLVMPLYFDRGLEYGERDTRISTVRVEPGPDGGAADGQSAADHDGDAES